MLPRDMHTEGGGQKRSLKSGPSPAALLAADKRRTSPLCPEVYVTAVNRHNPQLPMASCFSCSFKTLHLRPHEGHVCFRVLPL